MTVWHTTAPCGLHGTAVFVLPRGCAIGTVQPYAPESQRLGELRYCARDSLKGGWLLVQHVHSARF